MSWENEREERQKLTDDATFIDVLLEHINEIRLLVKMKHPCASFGNRIALIDAMKAFQQGKMIPTMQRGKSNAYGSDKYIEEALPNLPAQAKLAFSRNRPKLIWLSQLTSLTYTELRLISGIGDILANLIAKQLKEIGKKLKPEKKDA